MPMPCLRAILFAGFVVASCPGLAVAGDELAAATRLAEAGEVEGFYRLGRVYEVGREVERDLFEAARRYQRAAERGHAQAQFALGLLYLGALPDSPHDERESFGWFGKAAAQGHAAAAYFLAMSYASGVGTAADSERAYDWYRRAAALGNGAAANAIARMYASGTGLALNLPNAYAWNQVAIARDVEGASAYSSELEARMSSEELARANGLARGLLRKYGGTPAAVEP